MSALEQEILEKFHQLQPTAKQRVLALIQKEVAAENDQTSEFDHTVWLREVEALRQEIRASQENDQSSQSPVDVVGLLRDIRDGEDE